MESSVFKNLLNVTGHPTNKWLRVTNIREIIVDNESTHVLTENTQKIMFSVDEDLILIKESTLIPQSALLKTPKFNSTISVEVPSYPYKYRSRIRVPKVGDYCFILGSNNEILCQSQIVLIQKNAYGNMVIIFNDDTMYQTALTASKSNIKTFMYVLLSEYDTLIAPYENHPEAIFYEHDLTTAEADIIIPVSRVVGFEFSITPMNGAGI